MAAAQHLQPWQARLPFFYGWVIAAVGFIASVFGIGLTWAAGLLAVPIADEAALEPLGVACLLLA
jgi:hypothetical protein